jgi:hypothetical protein
MSNHAVRGSQRLCAGFAALTLCGRGVFGRRELSGLYAYEADAKGLFECQERRDERDAAEEERLVW